LLSREVIARIVKHSRAVEKPFFRPAGRPLRATSGRVAELTAIDRARTLPQGLELRPIFTIRDAGNVRRQIRYLAGEVTGSRPAPASAAPWNRLNQETRK
jgi:hypothetical protein